MKERIGEEITYHAMPMQLPNTPFSQMLLCSRNIMTARQIRHNLLTHPTTRQESRFRVRKRPFQVHDYAVVCALPAKVVWVLEVERFVCAAWGMLVRADGRVESGWEVMDDGVCTVKGQMEGGGW